MMRRETTACHTSFRPSARAFISGHEAGAAYVYFSYGVHWMLNVLVKSERAGFVLIRALEPLEGIRRNEEGKRSAGPEAVVFRAREVDQGIWG